MADNLFFFVGGWLGGTFVGLALVRAGIVDRLDNWLTPKKIEESA